MPVTKKDVEDTLAVQSPEAMRAILEAAQVSPRSASTERELAARIADAIWWNYCTPLGYVADRTDLEHIVAHVGRKLKATELTGDDAWEQLKSLTKTLVHQTESHGVSIEDLDPKAQARVSGSWLPTIAYGSSASGSLGAAWTSAKFLTFAKGPIGRIIIRIPPIAPYFKLVKSGAQAVSIVAGPLGVALAVLTVNASLGSNFYRLVPLLLGVGALGPKPLDDAVEVEPEPQSD
ncbi:MAG: hypothetical protein HN348_22900 [Proteobacteria bacterium]|jgi:hypothetical protein|nr:hypothetical protein [Pseudomonadota bacterium]